MVHSHSMNAVLATVLDPHASEFTVTHLEMIKVRPRSAAASYVLGGFSRRSQTQAQWLPLTTCHCSACLRCTHTSSSASAATDCLRSQGIAGHGFYDNCTVPIIENTARECELTGRLREAIARYPRSNAVLVRRHGIYVWGDTWLQASQCAPSCSKQLLSPSATTPVTFCDLT